jgi:hypothetical protein
MVWPIQALTFLVAVIDEFATAAEVLLVFVEL